MAKADNATTDPEQMSAYMVHHVLHPRSKSIDKNRKKKVKKPKKKAAQPKQREAKTSEGQRALKTAGQLEQQRSKVSRKEPEQKSAKSETNINKEPRPVNLTTPNVRVPIQNLSSFENHFERKTLFEWMIHPMNANDFEEKYWENKALHIPNARDRNEFSTLVSTLVIDKILAESDIQFTKNVDITFYDKKIKRVEQLEGRARPHTVWDYYGHGCSVRLLNPQTYVPNIHKLTSELQEYFGCFVGCNAYLTPPRSQGFAPHYDDIEAFILQIEGKKRWRVYEPRAASEELARFSSRDFVDADLHKPMMEVVLSPGDVLYIPRGFIHQAATEEDFHSLHITVSAYQRNAWIDLMEKLLPKALENASKSMLAFRQGLPFDYLHAAGVTKNPKYKETREIMKRRLKYLTHKLLKHMPLDWAVDQLGVKFMYDAQPPALTDEEKSCTIFGDGLRMGLNGRVINPMEFVLDDDMEIVLLRKFVCRLVKEVSEDEKIEYRLYYSTDNSLEYHGVETSYLVIASCFVRIIQYLFQSYPNYVTIKELPHKKVEERRYCATDLWDRGIIRTRYCTSKYLMEKKKK